MKRDTLKKEYEITHATFCVAGYVPPSGLFNMFQEVATLHANELGFGWEAIDVLKRAFVITKQKVVIKNPLQKVGVVSCETWPVAGGGRIASREYIIRDKDGEVLVVSSSKWVLIDIEKRQIAKLDDVYQLPGIKFREDMAIEDAIFTKVLKNENFKLAETVVIKKSHIDVNMHLNNVRYTEFIFDALSSEEVERGILEFEISFVKECKLGDEIKIYREAVGDEVRLVGEKEEQVVFSSVVKLA